MYSTDLFYSQFNHNLIKVIINFQSHLNTIIIQSMSRIKCEILQVSPERIKFVLNNCDVSFANALRRVLIAEVPTMAPHLISVYDNTSVLHDQFLAQRIGLIPFCSENVEKYKFPWKCDCTQESIDDCQTCKLQFRLQVYHKDNNYVNKYGETWKEVTSLDIQPVYMVDQSQKNAVMPVKFKSAFDKNKQVGIPIVKLNRGQQINIRFQVQKGTGKMHSKWSPVQLATFQPDPDIKVNHETETTYAQKQAIRDSCPAKVFEIHNGILEVVAPQKCIFCGQCSKKAQSISMERLKNYIKVGKVKDRFIFTVQSVGSMEAANIVKRAMTVLREKLESIQKLIDLA